MGGLLRGPKGMLAPPPKLLRASSLPPRSSYAYASGSSLFAISTIFISGALTVMKIAEFKNSADPNEAAQYEPPHQDLHCLSSSL